MWATSSFSFAVPKTGGTAGAKRAAVFRQCRRRNGPRCSSAAEQRTTGRVRVTAGSSERGSSGSSADPIQGAVGPVDGTAVHRRSAAVHLLKFTVMRILQNHTLSHRTRTTLRSLFRATEVGAFKPGARRRRFDSSRGSQRRAGGVARRRPALDAAVTTPQHSSRRSLVLWIIATRLPERRVENALLIFLFGVFKVDEIAWPILFRQVKFARIRVLSIDPYSNFTSVLVTMH